MTGMKATNDLPKIEEDRVHRQLELIRLSNHNILEPILNLTH